jgi:hypothetical protein
MPGEISRGDSCWAVYQDFSERKMPQPESSRPVTTRAGRATAREDFFM